MKRKEVEKKLTEKLILFKALIETIPIPIFLKDLDLKYIYYNQAFQNALGIDQNQAVGKTAHDLMETELAEIYQEMDLKLIKNLGDQSYESVVRFADGELRNIIFNKSIFEDEHGEAIGIVGVMTDITDQKEVRLLQQSILANKKIMSRILENDKMKTEFFSNISHEFRTPLNVILGAVQLMDLYIGEEEHMLYKSKLIRNIDTMKQNCYRLLKIVNNVIDICQIDAQALQIYLKECNLIRIVEDITLSISAYLQDKGINLIFDTDIEEKVMLCDEEKIERILLNLIANAVKFTPQGGDVTVSVFDQENGVCIHVEDTGIGIPEDKQAEIFHRFYQVDEILTRKYEGSGIGLNLVKSLVELHGGRITVSSKFGEGAKFSIYLPFNEIKNKDLKPNAPTKQDDIERINIEFADIYTINR